jgi:hypothetical protein
MNLMKSFGVSALAVDDVEPVDDELFEPSNDDSELAALIMRMLSAGNSSQIQ